MSRSSAPASTMDSLNDRESLLLAPYAMHSAATAGRRHAEPAHPYRGPFQRDRDRIVHSAAYRRLAYRTQVFTGELGDYHRSRLTHTLECSSVARTLARALRLNEDLAEALALAHDIGHPPFGHAGEDALDECLRGQGGFNHNAQALRIVEVLETRYPGFRGLNLSMEVLESQQSRVDKQKASRRPLLEAQLVDAADSVAYDTHDADDALEIGLLELGDLEQARLWAEATRRVRQRFAGLTNSELRRAVIHQLIDWQVSDLLSATRHRIEVFQPANVDQVRAAPTLAAPSDEMADLKQELEQLLGQQVYRHPDVLGRRNEVQAGLRRAFEFYAHKPDALPAEVQGMIPTEGVARTAADYLACLTDRAAQREFDRLAAS